MRSILQKKESIYIHIEDYNGGDLLQSQEVKLSMSLTKKTKIPLKGAKILETA